MYISLLTIDLNTAKNWIRNRYLIHQRLCMGFPSVDRIKGDPDFLAPFVESDFGHDHVHVRRGTQHGFLFRIDPAPKRRAHIFVQSALKPDWDYAFRNAPHFMAFPPQTKDLSFCHENGDQCWFCLEVNPTRKVCTKTGPDGKKRNGCRVPVSIDGMKEWLRERCSQNAYGFAFASDDVRVEAGYAFMKKKKEQDGRKLRTARFEGKLTITDVKALSEIRVRGIGPAKAFGFGLISLVTI